MLKKITKDELEVILRKHKLWLIDDPEGERANLSGANLSGADLRHADLSGANLSGANLWGADLSGADLSGADLSGANLRHANLWGADLSGANLSGADLRHADLSGANLWGADLSGANLWGADLSGANLRHANLWGADLSGADLSGANLSGANLEEAKDAFYPIACPEKGSFIAFKKASDMIVELEVLEDALRCSATTRKCRCSKARVVSITNLDGSTTDVTSVCSGYDPSFIYTVGEVVSVEDFNEDRWNECSAGIHFFITRQEAVDYN